MHPWIVAAALAMPSVAAAEPVPEPPADTTAPGPAETTAPPGPAEPAAEPQPAKPKGKAGGKAKVGGKAKAGGGTAEASGSAEADADSSGEGEGTSVRYTDPGKTRERNDDKWIYRWAPQRNMAEVGIYGGVWFPSRHLELYASLANMPGVGLQLLKVVAPEVGGRAGYYPSRFLGVELEGGVMPTRTLDTDGRATAWTVRGHLVAQLGLWSITPFLLVGTGVLGMSSEAVPMGLGADQDVAIHFGGGAKFYINRWIQLRLDIRDVVSNRVGVGDGLTSSPEILLGLSLTLGRKKEREAEKARPGAGDKDGDGVLDRDDYCVDVFGVPPRGCPQVCIDDRDGDGLSDPVDKCPDDPESRNGFEDRDGCPDEVPPELADLTGIMEGITFDTDKDTIKSSSKTQLDQAVEVMKKYPELRVRVTGHTDSRGPYRHNVDLSQRRAKAVKRYMVVDGGIDKDRIETQGFGPDQPIDTNDTPEGRAKNRRIEFTIIQDTEGVAVETKAGEAKEIVD
ncbi:OmpA family protein [Paraliomyxa miuraensis]|nr:OmpA family protein [Paraliomyxa miuraensis]